jgi:hypothetical protein
MQVPNGAASFDVEVTMTSDARAMDLDHRVRGELVDSFDEELEMEIDDDRLKKAIEEFSERPEQAGIDRALYFRELFRLQGELVKLQDWIVDQKLKVVVIFEGRRGQRRRHQAHYPAAQSASVPRRCAPRTQRTREHAMVFSALCLPPTRRRGDGPVRPQLVQPRRRRARDGILQRRRVRGISAHRSGIREDAGPLGH